MGLDVRVVRRRKILCPNCGEVVSCVDVERLDSGGRAWYDPLETIGYYVPYEKRTEENDRYATDMALNEKQARLIRDFAKSHAVYNGLAIANLIAATLFDGDYVVINADW